MRQDIKTILQHLTDQNPSDSNVADQIMDLVDDPQNSYSFIDHIRSEIQRIKDFRGDRKLFYNLYLSVAYLMQKDFRSAKDVLENAVQGFQIQGFTLDEALGEWLFGIIHFENKNYERAHIACETAITILQQLIAQCEEERKYKKAKELKERLLRRLERFQELVKEFQSSEDAQANTPRKKNPQPEIVAVKSKLRYYHDELNAMYEHLKEKKLRIPPTLVVAIFYIYKMTTPSHSVYSKVPSPETDREKEVYTDLIKKVGFFEVIEQLVELERASDPTARREEILEKINQEWDKEIMQ